MEIEMSEGLREAWEKYELKDEKCIYKAIFGQAYRKGFVDGYRTVEAKTLQSLWHDPREDTPKDGERVLVFGKYGHTVTQYYRNGNIFHGLRKEDVFGWMQIPPHNNLYCHENK